MFSVREGSGYIFMHTYENNLSRDVQIIGKDGG